MEIDEREIEQVLSKYTTSKLETVEKLVTLLGKGGKDLSPEERLTPTKRGDFFDYIKNIYDRLHPEGSEQREELLQSLKERLDEDSEQVLRGVGDGTQNIDTIDRTFDNLLLDTGERKGSFSAIVAMWDDKYRDKDEEMKIKIPDEEIKQYVFAIFYDELPNDQKKGKIGKLCEDMKESTRCISAIYQQLAEIEQHTASSDKKSKKLLKLMIAIALRYTANVDEDVKEALDGFLEQIADSKTISKSKKAQLMCLRVFFTFDPQMQRYLYQGLGEIARIRCVNAFISLCDRENYKVVTDRVRGESKDKKRIQRCLQEIQEDIESLPDSGNQRIQELRNMLVGLEKIIDTGTDKYLLAGSSKMKRALRLLLLPEDYKSMIRPRTNYFSDDINLGTISPNLFPEYKETGWIYYLLGAIDLIDKEESYYALAQKLRHDIIEGLEKQGLEYRDVLGEYRHYRYMADKKSLPGDIELYGPAEKKGDGASTERKMYTRKDSEELLLLTEDTMREEIEAWKRFLSNYKKHQTDFMDMYHVIIYCIRYGKNYGSYFFIDNRRRYRDDVVKSVYRLIASSNGEEGQEKDGTRFLLSGGEHGITFLTTLSESRIRDMFIEDIPVTSLTKNYSTDLLVKELGGEVFLNFIKAVGEVDKVIKLIVAIGSDEFKELLQTEDYGGVELAKFIKQLSLGQVNALGKRDVLFPFINELGGENLGKFMSEFGIRLGGAGKEDNPVSNDLKKALHIDNKDEFIDLVRNGDAKTIKDMMKKYGGDKLAILQIENGIYMRCGVPIDKLTPKQQELLQKLTPDQVQELSLKVRINKAEGQIEFTDIGLAIQDKNATTEPVHKEMADQAVQEAGSGWRLPKDKSSLRDYNEKVSLDPEKSDYDKMILQMPGQTDIEQVENFRLLTGMEGWYWTGTYYSKGQSMTRYFAKDCRGRDASSDFSSRYIRLVRDL